MATCDTMLLFLHEAFVSFSEVLTTESSNWEASKTKLQQLQEQWHAKGLSGTNALNIITQYQAQIKWQDMPPDQFSKFYRFIFNIFRDPGKRNIQMDLAVAAWRLILPGRFRLLDRWCNFAAASSALVVTQDLWRQVLDFSRTVHEDLSNFDSAGSWAVLLDEFVEDMRTSRRRSYASVPEGATSSDRLTRQASSGADLTALFASAAAAAAGHSGFGADGDGDAGGALACASFMSSISPRCGSKRRGPDVDVVTEQLSAMPLGAGQQHHHAGAAAHVHGPVGLPPVRSCGQPQAQASSAYGYSLGAQPYGGFGGGHRGSSPDAMSKRPCLDRHPQLQQPHPQPLPQLPQQPQVFSVGKVGSVGVGGEAAPGFMCGGGNSGVIGRTPNSGQPMSCSTGSLDSDGSQGGPAGSAGMDYWLPDPAAMTMQEQLLQQQQQQLCQPQHCPQRRAIKARRSGLSDIVKSAVADALGF